MTSLDNVSIKDLRQILAEVEGKKPTQRLMAAINTLTGVAVRSRSQASSNSAA